MKKKEMHSKSAQQLEQHAEKLAKRLAETRASLVTRSEKNVRQIRELKRERARALTIASQRAEEVESEDK